MGRGISHQGTDLTIINSTISGNSSNANGGGVWVGAGVGTIVQSTISDNLGSYGGGLAVDAAASATLKNTVAAGNSATSDGQDVYGTFDAASDYNLIGVIDGSAGLDGAHTQSGTTAAPLRCSDG